MSSTIMHLIEKKNSLRMRIKRSSSPSNYLRNKFKHLRSTVKKMLRDGRLKYMNKICTDRDYNPKRFWSQISNIPAKVSTKVNESERMYANNTNDIANMFNEYFVSIFSSDSVVASKHRDQEHNIEFENIILEEEEILAVIMNLDHNKAHGPDNIPTRLLKETAAQIAPSLLSF